MPKQRHILILARNAQEAVTYARRKSLPARSYRCVASAASIRGIQVADVHILPTFHGRRDSHAILAEFRWARDVQTFEVEMPAPLEAPPVDQGDGMGEQLDIFHFQDVSVSIPPTEHDDVAAEMEEWVGSEAGTPEQVEDPAPPAPRRRRSRCGECGELTLEAHDHASKPLAPALDGMF